MILSNNNILRNSFYKYDENDNRLIYISTKRVN